MSRGLQELSVSPGSFELFYVLTHYPQSNSGHSCTTVATEYIYHDQDTFVIKTEIFGRADMEAQVTRLLHMYRDHYIARPSGSNEDASLDSSGDSDSDSDDEISSGARKMAVVAKMTLQGLFGAARANDEFLCGSSAKKVFKTMLQWLKKEYPLKKDLRDIVTLDKNECSDALATLTSAHSVASEGSSDKELPWPYVRQIK